MTLSNSSATEDRDINDIFDDIVLTEENHVQQGYEEGFAEGASGNTEGYHLGYHRGAELGAEIGYYLGVTEVYLKITKNEKILGNLNNLKQSIDTFPTTNDETVDIFDLATRIRSKFRKTCALLKISGKYPEAQTLNF